MRNLNNFLLIMTFVFLFSCATTEKYETALNSWVNRPTNELFSNWGVPESTFTDPTGNKYYVFIYDGGSVGNTVLNPYGGATTFVSNYWCKTTFIANSSDVIQTWKWEGNSCKAK